MKNLKQKAVKKVNKMVGRGEGKYFHTTKKGTLPYHIAYIAYPVPFPPVVFAPPKTP
jgi:hypothetical protein